MTKTEKCSAEEFRNDQIVVANPHIAMVGSYLAGQGIRPSRSEESRDLGLTLLELPGKEVERVAHLNVANDAPTEPLSRLMHLIYQHFKSRYDGWVPTIGKNRLLRPVMGAPHNIGGGGRCWPTTADLHLDRRLDEPGWGVRVGVADTAIYAHPWLAGAYHAASADIWTEDEPASYMGGHATFIAGLIARRAPGALLEIRSVLGPNLTADAWDVARELVDFGRSGLDVLNLSLGTFADDDQEPMLLSTMLDRIDPGVVVVAAAGNHGGTEDDGRPSWPAGNPRVVAVTAVDSDGKLPDWSTSTDRPWVDVAAHGVDVTSIFLDRTLEVGPPGAQQPEYFNGSATWSGTSFATANVAGAIAALTVPHRTSAAAAVEQLLRDAPPLFVEGQQPSESQPFTKPWIK